MEKGLWQNSSSPDSSPISYMGKSTIQQNSYFSRSICSGQAAPASFMRTPAVFCAAPFVPEASRTSVFGAMPSPAFTCSAVGCTNLAIPPTISPFSSTRNQ